MPKSRVGFYRHCLNDTSLSLEARMRYVDSIILIDPSQKLPLYRLRASVYFDQGRIASAAPDMRETLDLDLSTQPLNIQCDLLSKAGRSLFRSGDFDKAVAACKRLLSIKKPDSLLYYDIEALEVLNSFTRFHLNQSLKYMVEADNRLADARGKNLPEQVIRKMEYLVLEMKMGAATRSGDYDEALRIANSLDSLPKNPSQKLAVDVNTALVYMLRGDKDIAEKYYVGILSNRQHHYCYGVALVNLTHLLNEQGRFAEAAEVYSRHRDAIQYLDKDLFYTYALGNNAISLAGLGRYGEAYSQLLASKLRADTIYNDSHTDQSILRYEITELTDKLERADGNVERHQTTIWLICAISTFITLIFISIIILFNRRKSAFIKKEELLHKDIESLKRDVAEKEEELEKLGRTGSKMSLQLDQLHHILGHIGDVVESGVLQPSRKIKEINKDLKTLSLTDDTWEMFSMHFEKASPEFLSTLRKAHPDMTTRDLRLASYIVMNLSSKEIAELTSRSSRSIDSARYRLAKKLNLPEGTTLASYLSSLNDRVPG